MKAWRIILVAAGLALAGFGIFRLTTEIAASTLLWVGVWLLVAVAVHDGLLSPLVVGVGWLLRRLVPDRGRRYLQYGLIAGAVVTVVGVPLILRRGSQPAVKALLLQDYGAHLVLLLGLVAVVCLALYAVRVARDRTPPAGEGASRRDRP